MYGKTVITSLPFEEAKEKVKDALAQEGFGIITEIDVQATMKKKLGADFPPYHIFGACNPALAKSVLDADKDIGLLLPCNVVVRGGEIATVLPTQLMTLCQNKEVCAIAEEVEEKLVRAIEHVGDKK